MLDDPARQSLDEASIDANERRLAIEAIATLMHIKKSAADLVLRGVALPEDLIRRFLTERDSATGGKRSKREAAATLLEELGAWNCEDVSVRKIIALAAGWTAFHLANYEYQARAVVQKAREMLGTLEAVSAYGPRCD